MKSTVKSHFAETAVEHSWLLLHDNHLPFIKYIACSTSEPCHVLDLPWDVYDVLFFFFYRCGWMQVHRSSSRTPSALALWQPLEATTNSTIIACGNCFDQIQEWTEREWKWDVQNFYSVFQGFCHLCLLQQRNQFLSWIRDLLCFGFHGSRTGTVCCWGSRIRLVAKQQGTFH